MTEPKSQKLNVPQEATGLNIALADIEAKKLEIEAKKLEIWGAFLREAIPKVSDYFEQRMLQHETPILKTGIWVLSAIVVLIVGGTGYLVYVGKLDAASFTFAIGTVLGYLLSFSKVFLKRNSE